MDVFEQLGPIVRFGQCIGQFPYRIETDLLNKDRILKRFSFSLCHPVTFWCVFVTAIQIVVFVLPLISSYSDLQKELESSKMPTVFSYITGISSIDSFAMLIIVRTITYRYHRLELFLKSLSTQNIRALEVLCKNVFLVNCNCKITIKSKTIIGIVIILAMVNTILKYPHINSTLYNLFIQDFLRIGINWICFNEFMIKSTGMLVAILFHCVFLLSTVANDFVILFFYLTNYSIADYIQLLRMKLTINHSFEPRCWTGSKKVLLHLYQASDALRSIFSMPVLYIITINLAKISFSLFGMAYALIKPNRVVSTLIIIIEIMSVIASLFTVFIVLYSADMPTNQVEQS